MSDKPYRVLTLDGGGVRGLYTITLLQQISLRLSRYHSSAEEEQLDIGGQFDLIVGTSTGSVIAAALVAGVSLERLRELYRNNARKIFQFSAPLQRGCVSDKAKGFLWALRNTFSSANRSEPLEGLLAEVFLDETLEQVYSRRRIALCVPTINAETQRSWVFKTPHSQRLTRDNKYKLVDVCLASSAAPIYFPIHGINNPESGVSQWFVDGGLWANNPVMVGLVEALELTEANQAIEILSIGTGGVVRSQLIHSAQAARGSWGWKGGADVVGMSLEAQAFSTPYLAKQIAKAIGRVTLYRFLDPQISSEEAGYLSLDAVDSRSLNLLESLGQRATDINMSTLTNATNKFPEGDMVLRIFKDVKKL